MTEKSSKSQPKIPPIEDSEISEQFASSRKIYVTGSRPDLKVPMREIQQTSTQVNGKEVHNPSIWVYDTSGPYTDSDVVINLSRGLNPGRLGWIKERKDTEELSRRSSDFANQQSKSPDLAKLTFPHLPNPRKAKKGKNVTQLHYAR